MLVEECWLAGIFTVVCHTHSMFIQGAGCIDTGVSATGRLVRAETIGSTLQLDKMILIHYLCVSVTMRVKRSY